MPRPRLLVTGSRNFKEASFAVWALRHVRDMLGDDPVLVHGAARGADTLLANAARSMGWEVEAHPAQWDQHTEDCPDWHARMATCKMAGIRRNLEMVAAGADLCIAFPLPDLDSSAGTRHCANAAHKAGIPTLGGEGAPSFRVVGNRRRMFHYYK